jgi:hypothetical protein
VTEQASTTVSGACGLAAELPAARREPLGLARTARANTARTMLLLDHEPLPWSRWGEAFADRMPDEIRRLQERVANASGIPRREAIRSRVDAILPLYCLSQYRPTRRPSQSPTPQPTGDRNESPACADQSKPAVPDRPRAADARETTPDRDRCGIRRAASRSRKPGTARTGPARP